MGQGERLHRMKKQWFPVDEDAIETVETDKYKYVMGFYDHERYGCGCFRISKYLKSNNFYIGHFVIVPEDFNEVTEKMIEMIMKGSPL